LKSLVKLSIVSLFISSSMFAKAIPVSKYNNVAQSGGLNVIYIWAPWCGNCAAFKPAYNSVKYRTKGVRFYEINGEPVDDPFSKFGIKYGYPVVQIFKNGIKLDSKEGGMSQAEFQAWIKQYK